MRDYESEDIPLEEFSSSETDASINDSLESSELSEEENSSVSSKHRWASIFESPEEMEKEFIRLSEEKKSLDNPMGLSLEEQIFQDKFEEALERNKVLHGDLYGPEKLKNLSMMEAHRETQYQLNLIRLENKMTWDLSPNRPIAEEIMNMVPGLRESFNAGDPRGMMLSLINAGLNPSSDESDKFPYQNKALGGNGGRGHFETGKKSKIPQNVLRTLKKYGACSLEAQRAYLKATGGDK